MKRRELKVKVWDNQNFCWLSEISLKFNRFDYSFEVDTSKNEIFVVQFTGIKDKNGLEIYEGDIVKVSGILSNFETGETMDLIGVVVFGGGSWWIKYQENSSAGLADSISNTSLIGNAFENKELLDKYL